MRLRALIACLVALVGVAAPAAAHQDPATKGFRSTVTAIRPAVPGMSATILYNDDQLQVTVPPTMTVLFLGYEGEPYIRFDPSGAYWNDRSPARYLNSDRFARLAPPERASATAKPVWVKVTDGHTYAWHDHRIHWMSPIKPSTVRSAPDRPRHVNDWRITGRVVGGPRFAVLGRLDYDPVLAGATATDASAFPTALVAGLAAGAVLLGGAAFLIARRRRSPGAG